MHPSSQTVVATHQLNHRLDRVTLFKLRCRWHRRRLRPLALLLLLWRLALGLRSRRCSGQQARLEREVQDAVALVDVKDGGADRGARLLGGALGHLQGWQGG